MGIPWQANDVKITSMRRTKASERRHVPAGTDFNVYPASKIGKSESTWRNCKSATITRTVNRSGTVFVCQPRIYSPPVPIMATDTIVNGCRSG